MSGITPPASSRTTGPSHPASCRNRAFLRPRREPALSESRTIAKESRTEISRALQTERLERTVPSQLMRWLKFNFVGGIGIGVQFAALFLLKSVLKFDYLAATVIAVEAAVVHNFVWHEQFTWSDRITSERITNDRVQPPWRRSLTRFARFNLTTGAVSIFGNLALMRVLVGAGHLNYRLANAIAIAVCSIANFLMSDGWVFEG